MYKDLRRERVEIFEETKSLCCTNRRLADSIAFSRQNQKVITEGEQISVPADRYRTPAKVVVSQKRSLAGARQYSDGKVCVLNFASATNAGGGVAELLELHKKRMSRILDIVKMNAAETVILGAFGCGAFQNPPDVVAKAMKEVVENYLYSFKIIEFAVYCPPTDTKNYDVFKRILS